MELVIIAFGLYAVSKLMSNTTDTTANVKQGVSNWTYKELSVFAESKGFVVTSTTGGTHNKGSKHYNGKAIDVRTRDKTNAEVLNFINDARATGITVIDERNKPAGQAVWGGAHLHLEV